LPSTKKFCPSFLFGWCASWQRSSRVAVGLKGMVICDEFSLGLARGIELCDRLKIAGSIACQVDRLMQVNYG